MNDKDFAELIESIKQAGEIKRGVREPTRIFEFSLNLVELLERRIRLHHTGSLSGIEFEQAKKKTLGHWASNPSALLYSP